MAGLEINVIIITTKNNNYTYIAADLVNLTYFAHSRAVQWENLKNILV